MSASKPAAEAAPAHTHRGPLRAVILASTGIDVLHCTQCGLCDSYRTDEMDLTFGELLQAAAHDDPICLTCRTLWAADEVLEKGLRCQAGLDLPSVILALQKEALERGLGPNGAPPEGSDDP